MKQSSPRLLDACGRLVKSLRISVTDRCNMRCTYCLPQAAGFGRAEELISYDDIVFVVQAACRLGIGHIRLTGGEPLVRPDLPGLVSRLKGETAVREVALTTNGMLLDRYADALADAGLDRLTVSVDSLVPDRYRAITCTGSIAEVWRGIRRAARAGLRPLKINVLVLQGMNDEEIDSWVALTRNHELAVRLLELMPIGAGGSAEMARRYVDLSEVRRRLESECGLEPVTGVPGNGPARYWRVPGSVGVVGFITPISDKFCDSCSRFRLTAVGELRPCLAYETSVSLLDAIRNRDAAGVEAGFASAAALKPAGHVWGDGRVTSTGMSRIGG